MVKHTVSHDKSYHKRECTTMKVVLHPFIMVILALSASAMESWCPSKCNCSTTEFNCSNAQLHNLPDGLPSSITYMDLSNNPGLYLPLDCFEKFKQLQTLKLTNCSVKKHLQLPESLISIWLSHNLLTIEMVNQTFSKGNWKRLQDVYLGSNKIIINGGNAGFSSLPSGISKLDLKNNNISKIGKNDLKDHRHLQHLDISHCGLAQIEEGSFDSLAKIRYLRMSKNKLREIPRGLFSSTKNLKKIRLSRNNLTALPDLRGPEHLHLLGMQRNLLTSVTTKELGATNINKLYFGRNKIESFDLRGTKYQSLDLSYNRITGIYDYTLGGDEKVTYLMLQDNNISYISPKAFSGIKSIKELFLQRSNLTSLPEGLFRNMSIQRLYLFANNLNNTNGLLHGMTKTPELVLVFANPKIPSFNASDYQNMEKGSTIYIGCNNLKVIESSHDLQAEVRCSPSNDLSLNTSIRALQGDGFDCRNRIGGNYTCKPCPVGSAERFIGEDGTGICVACPAGSFYQSDMASIKCKLCPPGQYVPPHKAPGKRAIDCLTCPKNTNTNERAGYRGCPCLPDYARTERFGDCKKCTQEGIKCKRDYQELKSGYWMTWESIMTHLNKSCKDLYRAFMHNLDIKNDTYDRSTVNFTNCTMPLPRKCPIKDSCKGGVEATCKIGYTGVLCAVCSDGYMKQFTKCRKCPSRGVAIAQSIAYGLSFVFVCFLISATDKIFLADDEQSGGRKRTFADIILSSLKILMGFYQVVSGLIHALSYISWPHSVKSVMSSFQFIQFEILRIPSLHCIKSAWRLNAVKEFWLALTATFAVPLLIFVYFVIKSFYIHCISGDSEETKRKRRITCSKHSMRAAALFLFATYPLTCTRIVQILPISCDNFCTVKKDGRCMRNVSYMRCDYSVDCIKDSSSPVLKVAYTALAIPFGLPIALFILLWCYAPRKIDKFIAGGDQDVLIDEDRYINARVLDGDEGNNGSVVQFAVRFAYENYKEPCWYWEVVEMVRKLMLTVGVILFLEHTKIGLAGIITIATVFAMAQAAMNPIKDYFENFLQLLSLTIVPINLSIGAIIHSKSIQNKDIIDGKRDMQGIGIILIILNSLLIALVTCRFIRAIVLKIISKIKHGDQRNCFTRCLGFMCACVHLSPVNERVSAIDHDR